MALIASKSIAAAPSLDAQGSTARPRPREGALAAAAAVGGRVARPSRGRAARDTKSRQSTPLPLEEPTRARASSERSKSRKRNLVPLSASRRAFKSLLQPARDGRSRRRGDLPTADSLDRPRLRGPVLAASLSSLHGSSTSALDPLTIAAEDDRPAAAGDLLRLSRRRWHLHP